MLVQKTFLSHVIPLHLCHTKFRHSIWSLCFTKSILVLITHHAFHADLARPTIINLYFTVFSFFCSKCLNRNKCENSSLSFIHEGLIMHIKWLFNLLFEDFLYLMILFYWQVFLSLKLLLSSCYQLIPQKILCKWI